MVAVRQNIGLDPDNPVFEGQPLTLRVSVHNAGLIPVADIRGFTARWTLRPYLGFDLGDAVLTKTTADDIANDGVTLSIAIMQGETTGSMYGHRHECWISDGSAQWPVLMGDFYLTPSPMAPART